MDTREQAPQATAVGTRPNGRADGAATAETEKLERTGPRKRFIFLGLGVIAIIAVIIWGVPWFMYMRVHESTDDARVDADIAQVTSKISERISAIPVDTNTHVTKGQVLVVLDDADERARLSQAQAQLDQALAAQRSTTEQGQGGVQQAQADVSNTVAQVPVSQAGVEQASAQEQAAQAQVPAAEAAYQRAVADYNRTASLVASGDLPRQQLDAANANRAAAAAQLRSAEDQVNVAASNVAAASAKVNASQAQVSAAQGGVTSAQGRLAQAVDPSQVAGARANVEIAKQNLAYTRITAPFDGFVGEKNAEVGQTVGPGNPIMTLIPDGAGKIFVTANFKETQLGDMKVGQTVDVDVDAYKGHTFHGRVVSINPASQNTYALVPAQNATGNFVKVTQRIPVRISIDDQNPSMPLRPGMSVVANVKVR